MNKRKKMDKKRIALKQFLLNKKSPKGRIDCFNTGFNRGWEDCKKVLTKEYIETIEILSNQKIITGLKSALKDFKEGRYIELVDLKGENEK